MCLKRVGYQNHDRRLEVYVMKTGSTFVEIFWIALILLFWVNIEGKYQELIKTSLKLKNRHIKREFYFGKWFFKTQIAQIKTLKGE